MSGNEARGQLLDELCINTIRFLSIDAVQQADSGHPGLPMGAAPMAYVLWTRFLKHNPSDPAWFDRDRFVLSAGHGSMLLYSLLHLTGYDLPMVELKRFRQWGSRTPGHPERGLAPGVEVTTGPLGQGFANAVGLAIAEAHLAARFNRPGFPIVDHRTWVLASDGDLMEGVAAEAASLAGHLALDRLIVLYDDNRVSLSAATDLTFTEDRAKRFEAYGWRTERVEDGNDVASLAAAMQRAREAGAPGEGGSPSRPAGRPTLILVRTHLGYGSPHKQDTFAAHGSPLGGEEVAATKRALGWPLEPAFHVPPEALARFRGAVEVGRDLAARWQSALERYTAAFPEPGAELARLARGELPPGWERELPRFTPEGKGMATRVASGKAMAAIARRVSELIGGSADLEASTHTMLEGLGDFEPPGRESADHQGSAAGGWGYAGRNIHFGVREHAMGAIVNGLAAHGGTVPFGSTFLIFSDYLRPSLRLAALQGLHAVFLFTHDSIGLGEDGPTHQPVEQLASLRAIPGFLVVRPADANEASRAWRIALESRHRPVALCLSRQSLPILDLDRYPQLADGVARGGYVLEDPRGGSAPDLAIVATGSEVHLALASAAALAADGIRARVVSLPCWELFAEQEERYRASVVAPGVPVLALEAGTTLGWRSYLGAGSEAIGVDRFGASAPGAKVMSEYGFTIENVRRRAAGIVRRGKPPEEPAI